MREQQKVTRSFKADGTVLTEVDQAVDRLVSEAIARDFPQANLITEEAEHPFDPDKAFTFVVDPIDGTDGFSQGMPGWCISVGLLDRELTPIAGIVYAPRWGTAYGADTLLFADIGRRTRHNGRELAPPSASTGLPEELSGDTQLCIGSKLHRVFDLSRFPGKIRSTTSTVINIFLPLLHSSLLGSCLAPAHIWDTVGIHAIIKAQGQQLEYLQKGPIRYRALLDGRTAEDLTISGTPGALALIRKSLGTPYGS